MISISKEPACDIFELLMLISVPLKVTNDGSYSPFDNYAVYTISFAQSAGVQVKS